MSAEQKQLTALCADGRWYVVTPADAPDIPSAKLCTGYDDDAEARSLAILFAAAPELLDACCVLLEIIEWSDLDWKGEQQGDIIERVTAARAAVAKAEGRTTNERQQ